MTTYPAATDVLQKHGLPPTPANVLVMKMILGRQGVIRVSHLVETSKTYGMPLTSAKVRNALLRFSEHGVIVRHPPREEFFVWTSGESGN